MAFETKQQRRERRMAQAQRDVEGPRRLFTPQHGHTYVAKDGETPADDAARASAQGKRDRRAARNLQRVGA